MRQPRITVTGTGTISAPPDQCVVKVGLTVLADSPAEAVTDVAQAASHALEALRAIGVAPADVRTTDLVVQDFFDQQAQRASARVGSYELDITVRRLQDLGQVLAALTAAVGDALAVRALSLALGDPRPLRRAARRAAVEDARQRAGDLAEATGARLGPVLSMEDQAGGPTVPAATPSPSRTRTGPAVLPFVPVEAGALSVTSRVTIAYALEQ